MISSVFNGARVLNELASFNGNRTNYDDDPHFSNNQYETGSNAIIVAILVGLIIFLCFILGIVAVPLLTNWFRRKVPVNPRRVDQRYLTIEAWLISKRVHKHDELCDRILRSHNIPTGGGRKDEESGMSPLANGGCCDGCDWEDESEHECPVCMEPLKVDEIVSWSANVNCGHVFHHECIKEWLLRRIACPYCRETMLPVDRKEGRLSKRLMTKLVKEHGERNKTTFFCIQEGLVAVPLDRAESKEFKKELKLKTKSGLTISYLGKTRGSRASAVEVSMNMADEPILEGVNPEDQHSVNVFPSEDHGEDEDEEEDSEDPNEIVSSVPVRSPFHNSALIRTRYQPSSNQPRAGDSGDERSDSLIAVSDDRRSSTMEEVGSTDSEVGDVEMLVTGAEFVEPEESEDGAEHEVSEDAADIEECESMKHGA